MEPSVENMVQFIIHSHQDYEQVEDTILEILDDALKSHIAGDQNQVRNQLRNLAQTKTGVFRFLAYAVNIENEQQKAISTVEGGEEALASIKFLKNRYEDLRPSIIAVYLEVYNDRINPVDSYDVEVGYREDSEEPMILFEASTGGLRLFETRMSSSSMSHMSRSILEGVSESVQAAHSSEVPIGNDEYKRIQDVTESIREQLRDLEEALEKIEPTEDK